MKKFVLIFTALSITSCSSIKSVEMPLQSQMGGLNYYMPKKDLVIKVKVENASISQVTFEESLAYPDLSKPYMLKYATNAIGKNTLHVRITKEGLLTSVSSTTISNLPDIFGSLGTNIGNVKAYSNKIRDEKCIIDGDYVFIYQIPLVQDLPTTYEPCGSNKLGITISKLIPNTKTISHIKTVSKSYSGIFYRQNEPYMVKANYDKGEDSDIVYSPSNSKTSFLPISKTMFANNKAEITLIDGMVTEYKQDVDSEVLALLQTPAKVIGGYFTAIGTIFKGKEDNDSDEIDMLTKSQELEYKKKKYDACLKAIDNEELSEKLGCYE